MSRPLTILLRVLLAAAGIGYIAWSLNWVDRVELPAGTEVSPGVVLPSPGRASVVGGGPIDPSERWAAGAVLTLELESPPGEVGGPPVRFELPAAALGHGVDDPRFKPGVLTTLRGARWGLLAVAGVVLGVVFPLQAVRWLWLMRCRGLAVSWRQAFRLTMVGHFFNFCMPGTTGGDVMKAYYAAKRSDRRATAVMSVVYDRVTGLLGLMLLGGLAGLAAWSQPVTRPMTVGVWLGLGGLAVVAWFYFSHGVRGVVTRAGRAAGGVGDGRLSGLWGRLPGRGLARKIDDAAVAYRDHKGAVAAAVAVSLPVHACLVTATSLAGVALGMDRSAGLLATALPLVFLAGSVPLTYQGLGVMEGLGMALLHEPPAATANQVVGMLLLFRLLMVGYAVLGSVALLRGDIHLTPPADALPDGTDEAGDTPAEAGAEVAVRTPSG